MFLTGCPPSTASYLVKEKNQIKNDECDNFITNDRDYFRAGIPFVVDTLNNILNQPFIATTRIELLNGKKFHSRDVQLSTDSLFYSVESEEKSIPLSNVAKITFIDKYTIEDFWYNSRDASLYFSGIAVLPASSRDTFKEAGKSILIGTGIGIVIGNLLGYRSNRNEPFQTVYISGIECR